MIPRSIVSLLGATAAICLGPLIARAAPPPLSALRVSADGHSLVAESGAPFFWQADTGWLLFQKLSDEETDFYLRTRRDQGFTAIQVMMFSWEGLAAPNLEGATPFKEITPEQLTPNPAYFDHIDRVVNRAEELGLYLVILPTNGSYWGDTTRKKPSKPVLTPENARRFGAYLGRRYGQRHGIIWALGGDRTPVTEAEFLRQHALVDGLKAAGSKQLFTYHPGGDKSSSMAFPPSSWVDINMCQSGHKADASIWKLIGDDYALAPAKPVIDGECLYEDIPCPLWRAKATTPKSTPYEVRRALYRDIFAGAFGVTYGANSVFQFHRADEPADYFSTTTWRQGLQFPGAQQVKHLKNLMLSRRASAPVPAPDFLISPVLEGRDRISALVAADHSYAMVYSAGGKSFEVDLKKLSGVKIHSSWFDPRTGATTTGGDFVNSGAKSFTPPASGRAEDWVLVLDDAAFAYPHPGAPHGAHLDF